MSRVDWLRSHFGFDSFRAGQEEAIASLLEKNTRLSLCLPARGNCRTQISACSLALEVNYVSGVEAKFRALRELLQAPEADLGTPGGATLVYAGAHRDAEEVAEFAREVCLLPAEHYHAGLPVTKLNYLKTVGGAYPVLTLTPRGESAVRWTRNIPPPAIPKRYAPNAAPFPFNPAAGFDELDEDDFDEE